jgi:hypothetical protein
MVNKKHHYILGVMVFLVYKMILKCKVGRLCAADMHSYY